MSTDIQKMFNRTQVYVKFHEALLTANDDLFPEFRNLRPILINRSLLSKNRPLFHLICDKLIFYKETGKFISPPEFKFFPSDETFAVVSQFLKDNKSELDNVNLLIPASIQGFLRNIGIVGISIMCNKRKTTGSEISLFPPPTEELMKVFQSVFTNDKNPIPLTCGGRAFSKHSIRDSSKFWGVCTGSNSIVNTNALKCIERIVATSVWNNVFILPLDVFAYEIRQERGYGARWEFKKDGSISFRGFLEPPMPDGHLLKWRH